jgi:hypothetical protein
MTDDMNIPGYCAKDNSEIEMKEGCKHPQDYCQHRSSCIIHFMEKEKKREERKTPPHSTA